MSRQAKLVWTLGLLLGCGGSETGNPIVKDPGESASSGCEVVDSTKLELGTRSELGFSADDVLAYAGGAHSEALSWGLLRFGSYEPEHDTSTLALNVAPRGAKLVHYTNEGGGEIATHCGAQLEIEVDLTLNSSGGALKEEVRATLVAKRAELATVWKNLDPKALKGTLTVTPPAGEGWVTAGINFSAQFTAYGVGGSLAPVFERRTNDSLGMSAGSGNLASFGLGACEYGGVAVPGDAAGAASSASTLALFAQHGTATLGATTATLTFEPAAAVCKYFGDSFSPYPDSLISIDGTLVVRTADGAIDGRWPVTLQSKPDANGQLTGPVQVQLDDQAPSQVASFKQVDTSGYDSSSVTVLLSLSASGWSGTVVVYGFTNPECPAPDPNSNGSPGCPGADRTELASFELH
jgi:hypothetical protein